MPFWSSSSPCGSSPALKACVLMALLVLTAVLLAAAEEGLRVRSRLISPGLLS